MIKAEIDRYGLRSLPGLQLAGLPEQIGFRFARLCNVQIRKQFVIITVVYLFCRHGGIGRRAGLKIPFDLNRVSVRPRLPAAKDPKMQKYCVFGSFFVQM